MWVKPDKPGPGQESVWDYPRPPRLESSSSRIRIIVGEQTIADSRNAQRILETSHPPVYYIPPGDIAMEYLTETSHRSFCEWKGMAGYYDVTLPDRQIRQAAWFYSNPSQRFSQLADHVAFYPSKMDACFVDGEQVQAQAGDFYGGWITSKIVGPFKGAPGTHGW